MARRLRVVVGRSGDFAGQLLEGLALRLGDQQRREDAAQHEQREDLHDVVEPGGGVLLGRVALDPEGTEDRLRDDGADLAGRGGEAVRGGAVAGREALAGDDEGGGVGAEVEEELAEHVEGEEGAFGELVVGEADDAEEDGQDGEAHQLDWLAANGVYGCNCDPVSWNGTGADDDQVTDSGVAENVVHVGAAGVSNSCENDRVVQAETVESNIAGNVLA